MMRIGFSIVAMVLGCAGALAQEAPVMGSAASPPVIELSTLPTLEQDTEIYRILVIGDSLAGGMGAGMTRMAELEPRFQILYRFNEASGIARPEVYDWASALPKIMEGKEFNGVVVMLGTNDRQGIRDGNVRYVFNTPDWISAYQARMDALIDTLIAQKTDVFWVSLPPMEAPSYEADMAALTAIQKERVLAKNANFIDIRANFLNPDGSYTDRGPDDTGEVRKLRARDGVAFFKQGNNRLGQLVLAAIKAQKTSVGSAPVAVVVPVAPGNVALPQAAPGVSDVPAVPSFGQVDANGTVQVFEPRVTVAAVIPVDVPKPALANALAISVQAGSAAEKLFSTGQGRVAPVGRFDDFSVTP